MTRNLIRKTLSTVALAGAAVVSTAPAQASVLFNFPNFTGACGTAITCVGNTSTPGSVLHLTPAVVGASGAGYSNTAVALGANATFSTTFQFRITSPGGIAPADGLTFVLAANSTGLGGAGGGIGYLGVGHSVAIEFDTFNNGGVDISSNHVAIDTDGVLTNSAAANPYGVATCDFSGNSFQQAGCMSNGDVWSVTIGYDGALLSVTVQDGNLAAQTIINAFPINIASLLGTNSAVVGFTSATGAGVENHDILNWVLANDTTLVTPPTPGVPEPLTIGLFGIGLVGLAAARRRR